MIWKTCKINVGCTAFRGKVSAGGSYFDSNDMVGLLESHFEDLSTCATADLPLTDQVCHLRWIPLWTDMKVKPHLEHRLLVKTLTECCFYTNSPS